MRGGYPPGRRKPYLENFWDLSVDRRTWELDEAVAELFALLPESASQLRQLLDPPRFEVHVVCAVDLYADGIDLRLRPTSIERMASLGAELSIDYYDYRPDDSAHQEQRDEH